MTSQTPQEIATGFLDTLVRRDVDGALVVVADDIVYENVSLPTVRGKTAFTRVMRLLNSRWVGFDYRLLAAAADGGVVLNERVDQLSIGPLAIRFWVVGRFEIVDAQIVRWRDYFDVADVVKGLFRGLVAMVVPGVQRRYPAEASSPRPVRSQSGDVGGDVR